MCMKKQTLVRDAAVMLLALFAAYAMVMLTQIVMGRIEGVAMLIFMLAVFVTSMYTEGYVWGVAASLISVLAVNFAFLSPYFAFNFTLSENLFSGLVMLVVSIMTSTLTTRIKKQEQLRMESEKEKKKNAREPLARGFPRSAHPAHFHLWCLLHRDRKLRFAG